jgi:hypothetical protein
MKNSPDKKSRHSHFGFAFALSLATSRRRFYPATNWRNMISFTRWGQMQLIILQAVLNE